MQFMTKEEVLRMRDANVEEAVYIVNEILTRVYNKAVEKALTDTPDLMLRLFMSQQAQKEMVIAFYDKNPEFKEHRDIVRAIVQKVESENPGKNYSFILGLSEPMIRQKIAKWATLKELPLDKPEQVNRDGTGIL